MSPFHLFHLFIDWRGTLGSSGVVWLLGVVLFCCFVVVFFSMLLAIILIELSNND